MILDANYRTLGKKIEQTDSGKRIDCFLGKMYPFRSRNQWMHCLRRKEILVGGKAIKAAYRLRFSDQIHYFSPPNEEPEVDQNILLLWENKGVSAFYKPSNLPMHAGGAYNHNTFTRVLQDKMGKNWAAVHRLDRETSGIVLCSEDVALRADLSKALRERNVEKIYLAIGIGQAPAEKWEVNEAIKTQSSIEGSKMRIKQVVHPDGLPSFTRFELIKQKKTACLLKVYPKTGRTHQIRVHSAFSGLPLVGDKKYALDPEIFTEYMEQGYTANVKSAVFYPRMCLHAQGLRFVHPVSKESCQINCPMPKDMAEIWDNLQ